MESPSFFSCLFCTKPRCPFCKKKAKKAYCRLSAEEKLDWVWIDDQVVCTKCLLELEKGEVNSNASNRKLLSSEERRPAVQKTISRLKKIGSGKVWERGSSFKAPYEESPAVTAKLSKIRLQSKGKLQYRV